MVYAKPVIRLAKLRRTPRSCSEWHHWSKSGYVSGICLFRCQQKLGFDLGDEPTFREYIKDPRGKIPGTKMIYAGLKDEQKIHDLLAYLKQFGPDGKKM